jgi:hypothetical protein
MTTYYGRNSFPLAGKYPRRHWWRSKFRSMIPALSQTNWE